MRRINIPNFYCYFLRLVQAGTAFLVRWRWFWRRVVFFGLQISGTLNLFVYVCEEVVILTKVTDIVIIPTMSICILVTGAVARKRNWKSLLGKQARVAMYCIITK